MNRNLSRIALAAALALNAAAAAANQQPTGNHNPAYGSSQVQAQLRLNVESDTDVVHFIRDTADPRIITKAYVLKHADPYSIRPYLREMVQATRVDYAAPAGAPENPDYYNIYEKAPTGVECLKYMDGTGMVIVSAEEYRFADHPGGMGIDALVARLDQPGIMNSSGQPKYLYFPKNRPARELQEMVKLVGANVSNDTVELIGGKDKVEYDSALNCLFFNTALYSRKHIEAMLKRYDIPHPEVRLRYTVYELFAENDGRIGADFQAWKNNDGVNFFSTGAIFRDNWANTFAGGLTRGAGWADTSYFNFNPKWNTRYLDFLVSRGRGRIAYSGDLAIQNGSTGVIDKQTGLFLVETAGDTTENPNAGPELEVAGESGFRFLLAATPSITAGATTLKLGVYTRSLTGYLSDGKPRVSTYGKLVDGLPELTTTVMIGNRGTRFFLGGIEKTETVRVSNGIPLLKDLPGLGWLFSTESESTKKSQLVLVAECELVRPDATLPEEARKTIETIRSREPEAGTVNHYGFGQYYLDPAKRPDFNLD